MNTNLLEYALSVILIRKRKILKWVLILFTIVAASMRFTDRTYTAEVKVYTRHPTGSSASLLSGGFERDMFLSSQEHLLRTRVIYDEVRDLEAPKSVAAPRNIVDDAKRIVRTIIIGKEEPLDTDLSDESFTRFQKRLSFRANYDAGNFMISYVDTDARRAADILKKIADRLIELNLDINTKSASLASDFMAKRLLESEQRLQNSSEEIATFIRENNLPNNEAIIAGRYSRYYESQANVTSAERELARRKALLDHSKKYVESLESAVKKSLLQSGDSRVKTILSEISRIEFNLLQQKGAPFGTVISQEMQQRLSRLKRQLENELKKESPVLDADSLQRMLTEARDRVAMEYSELVGAKVQLENLKKAQEEISKDIKKLPQLEAQLSQLIMSHTQNIKLHESLMQGYLNTLSASESRYSNLFLIDNPKIGKSDFIDLNRMKLLFLATTVIFVIVTGIIVFSTLAQNVIISAEQLLDYEVPKFMGAIQRIRGLRRQNLTQLFGKDLPTLRLGHLMVKEVPAKGIGQVVTFCSEFERSGKSLSCLAFASALSSLGHRVVVLDMDFRARVRNITGYYRANSAGNRRLYELKTFLSRLETSDGGIEPHKLNVVKYKAAIEIGKHDDPAATAMFTREFTSAIEVLRKHFTYVLVDAPPIAFLDTLIILESVDAALLCCPEGRSTMKGFQEMVATVEKHTSSNVRLFSLLTESRLAQNNRGLYAYQDAKVYQSKRAAG